MRRQLKEKFLPTLYARDFKTLLMKCDINEDDHQILVINLGGFKPTTIKNVVEFHQCSSLQDLMLLAHKVYKQQTNHTLIHWRHDLIVKRVHPSF